MKFKKDFGYLGVIFLLIAGIVSQREPFISQEEQSPKLESIQKAEISSKPETEKQEKYSLRPEVYYNKTTELNKELVSLIQESNEYVYFAVYTFTRFDIKDALLGAKHRGVKVIGLMDKKQNQEIPNQGKIFNQLKEAGIPIYTQDHNYIMHLKVLVTEKAYASGSYNWTSNATTRNDEVLEIGKDPETVKKYTKLLENLFKKYDK